MPALVIKKLRKSYGRLTALKGISFTVEKGSFFGFIGPNGAGKTTTIKAIMGLVRYSGRITVAGLDVVQDYREARTHLGLSPQEFDFDRFLTVEETLLYSAGYYGVRRAEAKRRAEKLLKRFKLWEKRDARSEALSGGMKRRLIIARALIHEPEILILDEPTAGLDTALRRELWRELRKVNESGVTIILTTHYIEEVEQLCDTVGIIDHGKLIALDKKERIMDDLGHQTLQIRTAKPLPDKVIPAEDVTVERDGAVTRVIGKGMKRRAKGIIDAVEKAGYAVEEIDVFKESLEHVFLRLTGGER